MAPRTINEAFGEFDTSLNLDPAERVKAERRHQEIADWLTAVGFVKTTFLQGSFARKTMPKPLKDVDMVVVLADTFRAVWGGSGSGGPASAMAAIRAVVESHSPDARFDVNGRPAHALQVTFPDCDFTFDLVPAFDDVAGGEEVFIADREVDCWERSNTRTLRRLLTERNIATVGAFVHQVRMGKAFKANEPNLKKLCGLVVESLAYGAIDRKMSHPKALVTMFEYAAAAVCGPVLDPTGVDDLAAEWTSADRLGYSQAFGSAAKRGREALALASDNEHQAAIDIWHDLLGESFPQPAPQSADQALTALSAGSITSTGRAVNSQRGVQPNRPGRSWRTP